MSTGAENTWLEQEVEGEETQRLPESVDGGADRNRTCDLLIANETLYQLSYDPIQPIYRHM